MVFGTPRKTFQLEHLTVVQEAIDQGGLQRGVLVDLSPDSRELMERSVS